MEITYDRISVSIRHILKTPHNPGVGIHITIAIPILLGMFYLADNENGEWLPSVNLLPDLRGVSQYNEKTAYTVK